MYGIQLRVFSIGGIITPADLAAYTAEFKQPVTSQLNNGGYTMYGPPPPSSGVVLQFIMGILDGTYTVVCSG